MQTVTKKIGDFEYEITKPLAELGQEFSLRIGKVAVPFLGVLYPALASGDWTAIVQAGGMLIAQLTPEDLKYVNAVLGDLTQVHHLDGSGRIQVLRHDVRQTHFCDRHDEWLTWLVFGIQTVSGSFFNGALGLGALLKKGPKKPASPEDNSGTKDDSISQSRKPVERTG